MDFALCFRSRAAAQEMLSVGPGCEPSFLSNRAGTLYIFQVPEPYTWGGGVCQKLSGGTYAQPTGFEAIKHYLVLSRNESNRESG